MSKRLEILKNSLEKKENEFNNKIKNHFETVLQANGQPLNDKRNGQATLKKWDRQSDTIRNVEKSIEITKNAIEKEESKIKNIEFVNTFIPVEIQNLVNEGVLIQWRKYPNMFFVDGVAKARIIWDEKKKLVGHKYVLQIMDKEQRSKFVAIYNKLNEILNK